MAGPSPHYVVRDHKRHSLYGTDDRIVLDLGSRVWKCGFSAEAAPRAVLFASPPPSSSSSTAGTGLWELEFEDVARAEGRGSRWWQRWESWEGVSFDGPGELDAPGALEGASALTDDEALDEGSLRAAGEHMVDLRLGDKLREVFHRHLMTDPRSRKIIVLENPLLPTRIKEMIACRLFEDLQVPSISFLPPHLLALLATGRTTGLVVDVGHLETVVLPIQLSRPLFPLVASSPLAGRHLLRTLYTLLLHFAAFVPPVPTPGAAAELGGDEGRAREALRVPRAVLRTDGLLERVLSEGCFVGEHGEAPEAGAGSMDVDDPPTGTYVATQNDLPPLPPHLAALHARYAKDSTARALRLAVPASAGEGLAGGMLVIPGWIRERVAEDLFDFGVDKDGSEERSIVKLILGVLEKLPVDLRVPLASSILVTGGTAMLPNFIPRLRVALLAALSPPATASRRRPHPHAAILPLASRLAILNDPSPEATGPAGSAPAFAPSLLAWIGGSLAGSLKIGAKAEVTRERWDEAREARRRRFASSRGGATAAAAGRKTSEQEEEEEWQAEQQFIKVGGIEALGDWTRTLHGPAVTVPQAQATKAGGGDRRQSRRL